MSARFYEGKKRECLDGQSRDKLSAWEAKTKEEKK